MRERESTSVRLPEEYAEELRNAAARRAYVEEVAAGCSSIVAVPLFDRDGATGTIKTLDYVRAYLRRGNAVLNVVRNGVPFLSKLIYKNEMELLELLLADPRVNVNAASAEDGCTVLMDACVYKNPKAVRLLLLRDDLDVNARDKEDRAALYEAAWQGDVDIVRMLVADGRTDVHARAGQHGWSVVDAALESFLGTEDAGEKDFKNFRDIVLLLTQKYDVDFDTTKWANFRAKEAQFRVRVV